MRRIKKIHPGSVALYSFLITFIVILAIMLFFYLLVQGFLPEELVSAAEEDFKVFGSLALIFFIPLIYAVLATVINTLVVLVYNLLSLRLGGLKVDLAEE